MKITKKQTSTVQKKKKAVWLAFDLSLNGDYEGLFNWLDEKSAKECGDGFAFFYYEFQKQDEKQELINSIKRSVKIKSNRDRFYAVWKRSDGKIEGSFLFGLRKRAPWEGAFGREPEDADG